MLGSALDVGPEGSVWDLGVILVSLGTSSLKWMAWADRISGAEEMTVGSIAIIRMAGVKITIVFLFVVLEDLLQSGTGTERGRYFRRLR
jgi:hypothetical protein